MSKTRNVTHKRLLYIYTLAKVKKICDGGGGGGEDKSTSVMDEPKLAVMIMWMTFCCNGKPHPMLV